MLKVLIVENELPAVERLRFSLQNPNELIQILATMGSVEDAMAWLNTNASPDLILMNPVIFSNQLKQDVRPCTAKSRILIRKGIEYVSYKLENAAYFYTEHRLVFLVDKDNKKHITETRNLSQLIESIDPRMFFRVNRKFIVNINFVKKFMSKNRTKMALELTIPTEEEILISQEKTTDFKQWVESL